MSQAVPLAGAIIVSTPQDLALIDARKGLNMFKQVKVPVLGIVENMSYFACPSCGERSDIFGHGGAKREAEKIGAPFLGEVPLHMDIRETSDAGQPVVVSDPDGPHAEIYRHIATEAWKNAEAPQSQTRWQKNQNHHGILAANGPGTWCCRRVVCVERTTVKRQRRIGGKEKKKKAGHRDLPFLYGHTRGGNINHANSADEHPEFLALAGSKSKCSISNNLLFISHTH